ncbi:DgyrCDS11407 [Dimorphilus gyrociliatus]|uniref:Galectin n=1 Tax=Dimorphilus gyrociliatus TaxID=2664684 RepID=A0A7I8W3D6_9ANNE|nr:DgyrCDS11407 [Dimorphilus gyrociliatus]
MIETYLHINCRFDQKCFILNTQLNGFWGDEVEIKPGGIIRTDSEFSCAIGIVEGEYRIAFNRRSIGCFFHKLPFEKINQIEFVGEINISSIAVQADCNNQLYNGVPFLPDNLEGLPPEISTNPPISAFYPAVPFRKLLPRPPSDGSSLYVSLIPKTEAVRFEINFHCNSTEDSEDTSETNSKEIAYHASFRVKERCIVLNSWENSKWQTELRADFRVIPAVHLDILIFCESRQFRTCINGEHLIDFPHRLPMDRINSVEISGDTKLVHVRAIW